MWLAIAPGARQPVRSAHMIFKKTKISGVFEIQIQPNRDERGFFARAWCQKEFEAQGLECKLVQCSISHNFHKGTLRGMHYQAAPFQETKVVCCNRGAIYDVVLDLRPESATFREWVSLVLSDDVHNMIYVPKGCAHGFLTLSDDTEVFYQMSEFYYPDAARGVRWDDPAFRIAWPEKVSVISDRDRMYADFG
jgi:dTDP-4-dehydrorhamnose 3,5-epimerase